MPLPYSLSLADGWSADDRGYYVAYIQQIAPVGMDIYMMGRFAGLERQYSEKGTYEMHKLARGYKMHTHNCITVDDVVRNHAKLPKLNHEKLPLDRGG